MPCTPQEPQSQKGSSPAAASRCCAPLNASTSSSLEGDEQIGVDIIREAAYAPATAIANNCGKQGNMIAEKIFEKEGGWGYNGLTDTFGDLLKEGVIDPVLVTRARSSTPLPSPAFSSPSPP